MSAVALAQYLVVSAVLAAWFGWAYRGART